MKTLMMLAAVLSWSCAAAGEPPASSPHARKALEIYRHIIAVDSSVNQGNVPKIARYLASELAAAGFPVEDVEVAPVGETAALIARYRGDGSSGRAPILLLGHMDVVEARAEDWQRPPFELTMDDTYFYARGSEDSKFGVSQLTATFIRLKKEGFVPNRDLIIAFSGDEETSMASTRMLAYDRPDLAGAEFALNSDAGGGVLDRDGNAIVYLMQAAEKTYVTWEITVRNPGGHSSRPRADNAIYELADAIARIRDLEFPVRWSEMTLRYFAETGERLGGELGAAMARFAENPADAEASGRLAREPSYVGSTRTTCVVTMLRAGHAENALPQSATATVNCRVFPGVPVAEVEARLKQAVGNEAVEFSMLDEVTESPISGLREDVVSAVGEAVHARYPGLKVVAYMESGGTDGMHFRKAGIPTWAVSGLFIHPDDVYAHGLDERVPIRSFYGALDHWSIILKALAGD